VVLITMAPAFFVVCWKTWLTFSFIVSAQLLSGAPLASTPLPFCRLSHFGLMSSLVLDAPLLRHAPPSSRASFGTFGSAGMQGFSTLFFESNAVVLRRCTSDLQLWQCRVVSPVEKLVLDDWCVFLSCNM
jgi:hypothetical protein